MGKLSFQKLIELCEFNIEKKYVADCMDILKNHNCIFEPGIIEEHSHLSSLYKLRLKIAKKEWQPGSNFIEDFERCISSLQISESTDIGITSLYGDYLSFLIFYEPITNIILGILKTEALETISNIEQNKIDIKLKGYSSTAEKYSKGKFVGDWK